VLSQTCEYALRAVAYIAQHGADGSVLAKDIAAKTRVPLKYLQKVLRDLVRSGILRSARGIGGGFQLSRPPKAIRLSEVVAPFDNSTQRLRCPFGNFDCRASPPCPLHHPWQRVMRPYLRFLETTTLALLIPHEATASKKRTPMRGAPSGYRRR